MFELDIAQSEAPQIRTWGQTISGTFGAQIRISFMEIICFEKVLVLVLTPF